MMPRRDSRCGEGRPARYAAPAPLYDRVLAVPEEPPAAVAPAVCPDARTRLEDADIRICRHGNPLPAPSSPAECEMIRLLCQQNALLTEILSVLSAQDPIRIGRP